MKKIYNIIGLAAVTLLMIQGCKSEKIEYIPVDGTSGDAVGYLSVASFDLQVADYAEEITSSGNDPELALMQASAVTKAGDDFNSTREADGDYVIRVRNISTGKEHEFSYDGLKQIENGQIATQYVGPDCVPTMDQRYNPNGSVLAIEGITSPDGRVLGKMGHTERSGDELYKNVSGNKYQPLFEGGVNYFKL